MVRLSVPAADLMIHVQRVYQGRFSGHTTHDSMGNEAVEQTTFKPAHNKHDLGRITQIIQSRPVVHDKN